MTDFLVKFFIKNSDDYKDAKVRQAYGMLSGVVGIFCNLVLFMLKLFAGIITGSVSISADAFNNLSDAGSSIITFIGFKMAGKPADTDHPFGHGRIEYISGLAVAAIIIVMAFELFQSSIDRIIHPLSMEFSLISVLILVASILMKLWMAVFNRSLGKRLDSATMKATATDSLSDCISTGVVLVSIFVGRFTGIDIDGYAGFVVAVFVLLAGIEAAKDTIAPLLGQAPDEEFVDRIEQIVMEQEHIIGVHDLIVHDYGPGRVFASMHAEVPCGVDVLEAHDIIDTAEMKIKKELGCDISIHMDPVVTDDEQVNELKELVLSIIKNIDETITMHDFRVTKGPLLTNLIFDIVIPFEYKMSDEKLKQNIADEVAKVHSNCYVVINVDKQYVKSSHHPS